MMKSNFHRVIIERDQYHILGEIMTWCWETIGVGGRVFDVDLLSAYRLNWGEDLWQVKTTFGVSTFAFRESKDAVLFALRWQS